MIKLLKDIPQFDQFGIYNKVIAASAVLTAMMDEFCIDGGTIERALGLAATARAELETIRTELVAARGVS